MDHSVSGDSMQWRTIYRRWYRLYWLVFFASLILLAFGIAVPLWLSFWPDEQAGGLLFGIAIAALPMLLVETAWLTMFHDTVFPLSLFCPHCSKHLSSTLDWLCWFCGHQNKSAGFGWFFGVNSFLGKCAHCKRGPTGYKCHHCGEIIQLIASGDPVTGYASQIPNATKAETVEETQTRLAQSVQHAKLETDLNLQLAERAAAMRKRRDAEDRLLPRVEAKTAKERLQDEIGKREAEHLLVHEIHSERTALAERDYKDNPEMLARVAAVLDRWRDDHIS